MGADVQDVARGIGLDGRIGSKFLHPGPGYGGSCFPKDTLALVRTAQDMGSPIRIVETVVSVNDARKKKMADKIAAALGGSIKGRTIAVLGITFKPNTDDLRDSPALDIVPALVKGGAKVKVFDPQGMTEGKHLKEFEGVTWCSNAYEAADRADVLSIVTEWNEFRALDLERIRDSMNRPVLVDLRNIYRPDEVARVGFEYIGIGRGHPLDGNVRN
jgi:UDPglucose 6-dehydrogenase